MPNQKVKVFSLYKKIGNFVPDNWLAIQLNSFDWFVKEGLKELFYEISPIKDSSNGELELSFLDYKFDEPKYTEEQVIEKGLNFEAPLRVKVKLVNKLTKSTKEQEVYLGDFPIMTKRGTFIINGIERVVVSQIVRSPGVYFTNNIWRGRKLFGAKIIPNRGAWLEFETEPDGFLGVKIDRKRKIPVTALLRVFGLSTNEEIQKQFSDIDNKDIRFIDVTLKKDESHSKDEAFLLVYKRLRPGELVTLDNAKLIIEPMFTRFDRYDLSLVGRYKFNQRLNLDKNKETTLDLEDLVAVVREIIRLNNDADAEADDIDHLSNRRVRSVGELMQMRLRVGFARLRRNIQDNMSTLDRTNLQPAQLINYKLLTSVVRDFFTSSALSQFMDQVNPLSELEAKRRLTALGPGGLTRERAGFEVRDVHFSYYGKICPIQTPEGPSIGVVSYCASNARVNKFGFLEVPYYRVKNGKVTDEVVWLDAKEEEKYNITQADVRIGEDGKILDKVVPARVKGKPATCRASEVDFIDVSTTQMVSVATSLIPFLEHNDAKRVLMGSNMQRQAVPLVVPEAPLVSTGQEEKAALDSGLMIVSDVAGVVTEVDASSITVKTEKGSKTYKLFKFKRSNSSTCLSQRPLVSPGDKVKVGSILADGPSIQNGVLSLGKNLLVAFIPFYGTNFEDAIILSERVAQDDLFTSIFIDTHTCLVKDTKLGPEITTPDIPNVSEEKLRNLDGEGIVRIGAEVKANDILVGKISPKGESELSAEERLLRAIFGEKARDIKDTSLTLPHGKEGRVIGIKIFSRDRGDKLEPSIIKKIQIEIAQLRKIKAGDKLAGRYGNKGVIAQIRKVEDMPYLEDGTPVDIVLNPLGVVSRMNLGQIMEMTLGLAAKKLNYRAIVENFTGATEKDIENELVAAGYPPSGKLKVYNGLTGEPFKEPIAVGYMYIMKLNHLVEDKMHVRSTGPYSLITQQPLGGKANLGGQRFGEMEVWALEGYGAAHTLQEMLTIKSDDILGRSAAFEAVIRGQKIKKPNIPASFNVLVSELKSLGLSVNYEYEKGREEEDLQEEK